MTLPLLRACHACQRSVYVRSTADRCPTCGAPLVPKTDVTAIPTGNPYKLRFVATIEPDEPDSVPPDDPDPRS